MTDQILLRDLDDALPLEGGDRVGAAAERAILPRLHFDEHDRLAVARDDVDFATTPPVAPGNNCVPAAFELAAREIFPMFSEGLARL